MLFKSTPPKSKIERGDLIGFEFGSSYYEGKVLGIFENGDLAIEVTRGDTHMSSVIMSKCMERGAWFIIKKHNEVCGT